jgi:hypothetical protein
MEKLLKTFIILIVKGGKKHINNRHRSYNHHTLSPLAQTVSASNLIGAVWSEL